MTMLKQIREAALEKFASVEEVDAFMEGFEKEAGLDLLGGGLFTRLANNEAVQKAAIGLGAGLLGAGIVKGFNSGSSAISNYGLRNKFDMALAQVMANNRIVKGAKPERAKEYAETIFAFAPHVASDANLLSSVLANAVLGEGLDPQTMKSLTELEGRYMDNTRSQPLVGIRA